MFVISFLQFVTAATGVAACIATIRGLAGNRLTSLGNFYVDLTRATFRVFLPLALVVSVIVMWQGTPMTFEGAAQATTVEGPAQTIARGVTAGVVSIKQLGTNGGGYFGPNSAHPYENPTPLTNLVETWSIAIIPMAMVWTLGVMVEPPEPGGGRVRHDARAVSAHGGVRRRRSTPQAIRRLTRWASISPRARWKARKSDSDRACRRSGR